jgi:inosine-uridine nucleoside N-ribohydrolase
MSAAKGHIPLIIDTDTNNDIDDQMALAYALYNPQFFDIKGITVHATDYGGSIEQHYEEASRILQLSGEAASIPLVKGVEGRMTDYEPLPTFDKINGIQAVEFIIVQARLQSVEQPLVVAAIGKLTHLALALAKCPDIASLVRVVWLGSNYPDPGEYNLMADVEAVNAVLQSGIRFEIILARFDSPNGAAHVQAKRKDIVSLSAQGSPIQIPVVGRHGGLFHCLGDYLVDLFQNKSIAMRSEQLPICDLVALAVLKNPEWGQSHTISTPYIQENNWVVAPDLGKSIKIWENFDGPAILADFFQSLRSTKLNTSRLPN